MISTTKFTCRKKKQSEDRNLTSPGRFYLRRRDFVFAVEKKKARLGEDKDLTSPNILKEEDQSKSWLSLKDEDIRKIDD